MTTCTGHCASPRRRRGCSSDVFFFRRKRTWTNRWYTCIRIDIVWLEKKKTITGPQTDSQNNDVILLCFHRATRVVLFFFFWISISTSTSEQNSLRTVLRDLFFPLPKSVLPYDCKRNAYKYLMKSVCTRLSLLTYLYSRHVVDYCITAFVHGFSSGIKICYQ